MIKTSRGFTLIELVMAIGLLGLILLGLGSLVNQSVEETKASVTASHIRAITDAANAYIRDHDAAIRAVATDVNPALIQVADLVNGKYIDGLLDANGVSLSNPYGQQACVLVLEPLPVAANPTPPLTGLAITAGGTAIDDVTLGHIAALAGPGGGAVYSTGLGTVRGAMNGWSFPVGGFGALAGQNCGTAARAVPSAGHLAVALWLSSSGPAGQAATLYREQQADPDLNTMRTPILLAGLSGGNQNAQRNQGDLCGAAPSDPIGALARDAQGGVLSCVDDPDPAPAGQGHWKQSGSAYWSDPVEFFVNLPACDATAKDVVRVVRRTNVALPNQIGGQIIPRAYFCNGAGSWLALGLDNAGVLNANEVNSGTFRSVSGWKATTMSPDGVDTTGRVYAEVFQVGNPANDNTKITPFGLSTTGSVSAKSVFGIGGVQNRLDSNGGFNTIYPGNGWNYFGFDEPTYSAPDITVLGGRVVLYRHYSEGGVCPWTGQISRTSAGDLLVCDTATSRWRKTSGISSVVTTQNNVFAFKTTAQCQCPAGYLRTGCSGGREATGVDSCNDSDCGVVGTYPAGANACTTNVTGAEASVQAQAFCYCVK